MEIYFTATLAFLLAGFVKGVLGFGFPIIALVVMTLSIGLLDALAIIVVPTLVTNIWQALDGPYLQQILRRMGVYFALAMLAIFASSWFLVRVNVDMLTAMLGGVLFFFALSRLFNFHITVPREREGILSVVLGTVNGFLTGFTGSFMVPSVLYMQALGFQRDMLVQAMGTYFALSTFMLAVSLGRNALLRLSVFSQVDGPDRRSMSNSSRGCSCSAYCCWVAISPGDPERLMCNRVVMGAYLADNS